MQFSLNNLKPYAETMRAWLVNLSVASMAVGLFNGVLLGLFIGGVLLISAFAVVYLRERYMK